jgi:hypothetical protein
MQDIVLNALRRLQRRDSLAHVRQGALLPRPPFAIQFCLLSAPVKADPPRAVVLLQRRMPTACRRQRQDRASADQLGQQSRTHGKCPTSGGPQGKRKHAMINMACLPRLLTAAGGVPEEDR